MAHFAKIENGVVTAVNVVNDSDIIDHNGSGHEEEVLGAAFCMKTWGGTWKQCSYNTYGGVHSSGGTPLRANYPSIGWLYNEEYDIFHQERPTDRNGDVINSWSLNATTGRWEPPYNSPDLTWEEMNIEKKMYLWDETIHNSDNVSGWVFYQSPYPAT